MPRKKTERSHLTRRQFLRTGAQGLIGAVVGGVAASQAGCQPRKPAAPAPAEMKPPVAGRARVILIRDERMLSMSTRERRDVVQGSLNTALMHLTGTDTPVKAWGKYAKRGERIAIKSNLMMRPVHPELLNAIHAGLTGAGVADADVAAWDRNSAGFGRAEFESLPRHPGFGEDSVSKLITDWATGLINVTGLKAHWLAGIGCALKNWAGAVTSINVQDDNVAYAFHGDSCADIGILNAIPAIRDRCRLIVIDALQPLFSGGPQVDPTYLWDYNGLIVGTDPVAVDAICARIIQAKRDQHKGYAWPISPPAKHIEIADTKYGLGVSDPKRIDLVKLGWAEGVLV